MQSPPRIKISRKKVTFPAALFYAAQQRRSCRSVLRGPAFCVRQDAQALRRRTVKGDCRTCRFLAGHPKPEERPVPLGNAGFFQTLSKKKCARFQLPSYEIAVTIAHVRQRVKGFQEKGPVRGGLAGRARPGWPFIKKRTAGPTPTCMGPAVLYRRIRRRVRNPVYSPNNEACLINRHAVPLADLRSGRAYSGRTASFAPTADARRLFAPTAGTKCLSRLRRSLRKQTAIGLFCAPRRKSYESSYAIVTAQCFTGRTASFRAYGVP